MRNPPRCSIARERQAERLSAEGFKSRPECSHDGLRLQVRVCLERVLVIEIEQARSTIQQHRVNVAGLLRLRSSQRYRPETSSCNPGQAPQRKRSVAQVYNLHFGKASANTRWPALLLELSRARNAVLRPRRDLPPHADTFHNAAQHIRSGIEQFSGQPGGGRRAPR